MEKKIEKKKSGLKESAKKTTPPHQDTQADNHPLQHPFPEQRKNEKWDPTALYF